MEITGKQGSNCQRKKVLANENQTIFISQQRERKIGQTFVNSAGNLDFLKNLKNFEKDLFVTC